jgi:hypothetical protein
VVTSAALVHLKEAFADAGPRPDLPAVDLAGLTRMEVDGKLTATQAKAVLAELLAHGGGDAGGDRGREGLRGDGDRRPRALVAEAIAAQPDAWAKFCAGEGKAMGALVGHIMKASKGQADGKLVSSSSTRRSRDGHRPSIGSAAHLAEAGADRVVGHPDPIESPRIRSQSDDRSTGTRRVHRRSRAAADVDEALLERIDLDHRGP